MSSLSHAPFIGLGFIVIGFAGFLAMAVILDDHPGLFAIIIGWYLFIIGCAAIALAKDARSLRRFRDSLRQVPRPQSRLAR